MAAGNVRALVPPPTEEERRTGILNAMAELNSLGITCVTEPGLTSEVIRIYTELFNEGKFTLRVNCMVSGGPSIDTVKDVVDHVGTVTGFGNEWLRISGLKLLADGIPPSKTAFMYDNYLGGGHGKLLVDGATDQDRYEMLMRMIKYASHHGFQVGIHVTGDRGIDACVDGYIAALGRPPLHNPYGFRDADLHEADGCPQHRSQCAVCHQVDHRKPDGRHRW